MGWKKKNNFQPTNEDHSRQVAELSTLINYLTEVVNSIEVTIATSPLPDPGEGPA